MRDVQSRQDQELKQTKAELRSAQHCISALQAVERENNELKARLNHVARQAMGHTAGIAPAQPFNPYQPAPPLWGAAPPHGFGFMNAITAAGPGVDPADPRFDVPPCDEDSGAEEMETGVASACRRASSRARSRKRTAAEAVVVDI